MLYPIKFKPLFKERIWGGSKLASEMNKDLPKGVKIGESWELSGVEGDISVVSEGKLKGNNLQELIEVYMGDLIGDSVYEKYGVEFPLLIKLLDAQSNLSIQVHPDDEVAKERHNSYGKTEAWYILDCEPGASIYLGFKKKTSREEYLKAVEQGNLPDLLNKIEVKRGDSFFIQAGTVHALGKGVLVAEIQQTSDITYRIDDWGRVDDEGKPRELHTDLALDVIDFNAVGLKAKNPELKENKVVPIEDCKYFTINAIKVNQMMERIYLGLDSFVIYMALDGDMEIEYTGGKVSLKKGETILVPAQEDLVKLHGEGTVLEVYTNLE